MIIKNAKCLNREKYQLDKLNNEFKIYKKSL